MIQSHQNYRDQEEAYADIVIVGTGAGGATIGKELAEAGFDVLFIEEGAYQPTSSFNPYIDESVPRLYRDGGGTVILGKAPIPYLEGRCVGGSTVINGGMTWRAPEHILDTWAQLTGDDGLGPKGMNPFFDNVETMVHAKHQHPVSIGKDNDMMARGAAQMGWEFKVNRRNQDLCVGANNCVFGCPTGAKQSTLVSYMPKAMAAGARAMTEVRIESLLIERGRCVGVQGRSINPRTRKADKAITIRGKYIIIACGAVQSAYLLLKHKLARQSKQLGRNFFIHPNAKVLAIYPHELDGWQGVSQLGQIRQFHEEGIVMADNMVAPGPLAGNLPFHGNKSWDVMQAYNRTVLSGVLVEDSQAGRIRRGPFGMVIPRYDITAYDHARFLKGVKLLATMHFEMGAERVILPFDNFPEARSVDELKGIEQSQRKMNTLELFTVHLMGTARMGGNAQDSVVNTEGEIWDLPGCYVADASIFPTAIGVNPQITIMAMATRIAHRLADRGLKREAA